MNNSLISSVGAILGLTLGLYLAKYKPSWLAAAVLLVLQITIAWFTGPIVVRYIPGLGRFQLLVYATVFAVLVWVVGLVLSQVLRAWGLSQVLRVWGMPSSSTLVASLIVALIGAAVVTWLPVFLPGVRAGMRAIPDLAYPLIGAVIGYHIRR